MIPICTIFLLTYNHESSIKNTLESILSQKTQFPFIVKILEDYSTDNTLKICKEYTQKYPHLFEIISQEKNTNREHIYYALKHEIKTKYWCIIEGDDFYINNSWLEKSIKFLEKNKEYNCYCGDVLYNDIEKNTQKSCIIDVQKKTLSKIGHDLSINNYLYIQTSARMYRNIIDFNLLNDYPLSDIYIWYLFLDKGKVYLDYELMSQYNINSTGIWNTLNEEEKRKRTNNVALICNKFFNYKYSTFFSRQIKDKKFKIFKLLLGSKFSMWLLTNNYLRI